MKQMLLVINCHDIIMTKSSFDCLALLLYFERHTVFRDFSNAPESKAKDKMKEDFKTMHFPLYFAKFASLLQENGGEYVAGKNLTYGDLTLINFLEVIEDLVDPDCLAEFPTLKAHQQRIFDIPEIKEWRLAQKSSAAESGYPENG